MRAPRSTIAGFPVRRALPALLALLTIGMAGSAGAAELPFKGTFDFHVWTLPSVEVPGSGIASVSITGANHLASLALPASLFGPVTASLPMTSNETINSVIFTGLANAAGTVSISGGGSAGTLGLTGTAKICLVFAPCQYAVVNIPLTPTASRGFGIGGTQMIPAAVAITLQHAPWTLGQPVMTVHTPGSNITSPPLPGGFAHGPASLTSSTATGGGVLQIVTATKAYTSLTGAFPEFPIYAVLNLGSTLDSCSDGSDNDGDGFTDFPDDPGCDDAGDDSEQSSALVCDNGADDDDDGLVDVAEDPGCDHPTDPSEKTPLIACDDGDDNDGDALADLDDPGCAEPGDGTETDPGLVCDDGLDNDDDGLVDTADPGCDDPLDPFEQNCGKRIPFTDNGTEDASPAISESRIAWHQWDTNDPEILLWDGSKVTPLSDNAFFDQFPAIAGDIVVWEEWGGSSSRIMLFTGSTPAPLSDPGVDAWDPDTDGTGVVWSQGPSRFGPPEGVYHWDGSGTTQVFGSAGGVGPAISGERIVWETATGIHMWTGSATVVIPGSAGGHAPAISGQKVVWHASDGSDDEIYLWNGSTTQPLTSNAGSDRNADISGNRVVWESADGIQVWQGGATSLIAESMGGQLPKIDDLDVVWQASDGSDGEIFLVTLCVACNDGVDNDGDAKIDYDGGLSALGYVAAEADPRCGGDPWKKSEAAYNPCGLGIELALLLPPLLWLYRRRRRAGGGMLLALVALLAVGIAGNARAAELPFTGTLDLHLGPYYPGLDIEGAGLASVSITGTNHLASLVLPSGAFGPITTSIPLTSWWGSTNSVIFTGVQNLAGSFPGISGGPMGLSGTAKICLMFAPCQYAAIVFPLTPSTGGVGFGIGGTQTVPGAVRLTLQHAPWTIGQPVMTIHTPNSNVRTPTLPGGFAHGPASLTSSTAAAGAELQMVTATKAYTSLTGAFPEMPVYAVLNLTPVLDACSDGADNDGDGLTDFPDDPGCDDAEDASEQSPALVCDNGADDDDDGLADVAEDPGCDHPTDPSEKTPLIACDDGDDNDGDALADLDDPGCAEPGDGTETDPGLVCDDGLDNDDDGLVDTADPGCDDPLDPFEQNCGKRIPFTDNGTEDASPAISESRIAWHQWDTNDPEILLWDGSKVTPLSDNAFFDQFPAIAGDIVVWEEWGGSSSRIMLFTGSTPASISDAGVSGWDADIDGSGVVWSQASSRYLPSEWVYHWNGSERVQVFGSAGGVGPAISGERIVWETTAGIHMWTGSTTVVIPGSAGGHAPAISGAKVVWHASDGSDDEIYLWNGSTTQPLTSNASDDHDADISGNRVVWASDAGIQVWQSGETSLIADSVDGQFPKIDDIDVVWQASDGSDNEIFLLTLCVACNDGVDNDGDTKIDYDGGLSALGYVAAEADPQCGDNPWKRNEKPYLGTCGLGIELALLLPPLFWLHRRRRRAGGGMLLALLALLAIGITAGSARAEPLAFTGTLKLHIATLPRPETEGAGIASVSVTGVNHLASLALHAGVFGPLTTSIPLTAASGNSIIFTSIGNLSGSFPAISGGPPGGGSMGLTGTAKICLVFAPCQYAGVPFPLAPTSGGAGFGIGGTVAIPGAVAITMQHAPWTIGQPLMTIHTAASNLTSPVLPGGFAHGPLTLTSSTAQVGGELQMVTATKAYTSLTGAFPEMPIFAVLNLKGARYACDDGADNDGDGVVDFPDDPGCDAADDNSEQSSALVCDNGLDDDSDGLIDVAEDPGCDQPADPSEKGSAIACDDAADNDGDGLVDLDDPGCVEPADTAETDPSLVCDDGSDNDGDGLIDAADAGCDDPLDPFEQNCGVPIPFTANETEDAAPAISKSRVAWHQWDGSDFEILLWDGSSITPLTNNALNDTAVSIGGSRIVWEEWGAGSWRIMRWQGHSAGQLSHFGEDGWDANTDGEVVVWSQGPSRFGPSDAVHYWTGASSGHVSGSAGSVAPAISGERIVWETAAGIHMWIGSTTVLIPGSAGGHAPAISGHKVVWHASDGSDNEIYLWNGSTTQPLTSNASDDRNADISGNRVVWASDAGIQVWQSGETSLIADSVDGQFPKIDDIDVVWQASDGSDNEIFLLTLCVACNDGVDNDGDTKIDYDGGLSALGYVAAEADPQCGDNPWKKTEATYNPCGLGIELALLLPPLLWLHRRRRKRSL